MKKNQGQIKNLIFDIGGVVVRLGKLDFTEFDKKWSLKEGTTKRIISACFKRMSSGEDFNIQEYLNNTALNFEQYKKITKDLFQKEKVNQSLISWIRKKRANFNVYALTNNTSSLDRLLREKFKIYNDFDYIFNSSKIGFLKPNPKIFQYVLDELEAEPKECLFVDDNQENIKTAKDLGFHTILFKDNQQFFEKIAILKHGNKDN